MNIKYIIFSALVFLFIACNSSKSKHDLSNYKVNYSGVMDTIIPHFAKKHDTIPAALKFSPKFKWYYDLQIQERNYQWMNYTEAKDGYSYFLIKRDEPSIKRDKFIAICGRFKRSQDGRIDSASYEEIFWTWKMKVEQLNEKAQLLFDKAVDGKSLADYTPEKSKDEWIEFPGNGAYYNKASQTWETKSIQFNSN
jgi:hypothetical protein